MSRLPRGNLLLDRPDHRNVSIEQYLETKPRRCRHQLPSQRKTPRSRKAQRSGISRQLATIEVPRHYTSDTDHPLEAGATEAIEEEGLLEDIRGRVALVHLLNDDGDTRDRPKGTVDTPCPGAGVAPGTIVTDLLAGDPHHHRGAETPILDVDRVHRGDSNVDGLDHDPP